jgi:hypothetical protein
MTLRELGQCADRRRGGVPRPDDEDVFAGEEPLFLSENVRQFVDDVRFGGGLAQRRDAAVAEPAVPVVGTGAVEDDVGLLDPLRLVLAND